MPLDSIEKIGLDLSGLMQNSADQDEVRLLGVKHVMSLKPKATNTERHIDGDPADAGKTCQQVERTLQPSVVGLGLVDSECSLRVIVNFDKVSYRAFGEAEVRHGGLQPVDALRSTHLSLSSR